jgi:hypothetical protein
LPTAFRCFELRDEILGFTGRRVCRLMAVTAVNEKTNDSDTVQIQLSRSAGTFCCIAGCPFFFSHLFTEPKVQVRCQGIDRVTLWR